MREWNHSLYEHLYTYLKSKKCLTYVTLTEFWKLNTTCNISPETTEIRIWTTLKGWGRRVFVESRTFKCEGEKNDHMLHFEQVFDNIFERRERKCCGVLMKHLRKVKGEQVVTLQMIQLLKPEILMLYQDNYFVVSVKLNFC